MSTLDTAASRVSSANITTTARTIAPQRVASVDILRGIIMVLMAIDHVRVFSGLPAGGPTPGIFFTRWVTHFCAPWFVFLAGTSAFLREDKLGEEGKGAMARYLALRGLGLVVLELTVLRFCWTFNFDYAHYILFGVIWAIGWCMVLMAGLIWLGPRVAGAIGVIIICTHNLINLLSPQMIQAISDSSFAWLWRILYFGGGFQPGGDQGPVVVVLYSIVPWIGVMAAGYGFGAVLRLEPQRRNRICLILGAVTVAAFLILRGWNLYGDPGHWGVPGSKLSNWLAFLNTTKYPASLQFLLMTLGPGFLALPVLEKMRGFVANTLSIFGRVPLFYYALHIPLIHVAAIVVSLLRTGHVDPWLFANHPVLSGPAPQGYTWSLGLLYVVWAVVVGALYFACRWYAAWRKKPGASKAFAAA